MARSHPSFLTKSQGSNCLHDFRVSTSSSCAQAHLDHDHAYAFKSRYFPQRHEARWYQNVPSDQNILTSALGHKSRVFSVWRGFQIENTHHLTRGWSINSGQNILETLTADVVSIASKLSLGQSVGRIVMAKGCLIPSPRLLTGWSYCADHILYHVTRWRGSSAGRARRGRAPLQTFWSTASRSFTANHVVSLQPSPNYERNRQLLVRVHQLRCVFFTTTTAAAFCVRSPTVCAETVLAVSCVNTDDARPTPWT